MSGDHYSDIYYTNLTLAGFQGHVKCNPYQLSYMIVYFLTLGIAGVLSLATLTIILCHRQLRCRRFIFQFNIVLADVVTIVTVVLVACLITYYAKKPLDLNYIRLTTVLSTNVSLLNIFFVAVYQLITIRIDPFGVRNIITTPRCIAACVASWILTGIFTRFLISLDDFHLILVVATASSLALCLLTGFCIFLIYSRVSKAPCNGNIQLMERKRENKQLLCTFALVYATTCVSVALSFGHSIREYYEIDNCFFIVVMISSALNLIANSVVYWWRLKEFRSLLPGCRNNMVMPMDTSTV